jgi:hypothetical protein
LIVAIYRHPDGSFKRYPPTAGAAPQRKADPDDYDDPANWRQKPDARPGIEIHRDGKRMRNTAPTPAAK